MNNDRVLRESSPQAKALIGICTDDLSYVKVTADELPTMGVVMGGGAENVQKILGQLIEGSKISCVGKQASGGALDVAAILMYSAGKRNRLPTSGKPCGQSIACTGGADALGAFVSGTQFRADKRYAILGYRISAASLQEFAVLRHPDFGADIYLPAQGITGTYAGRDMNEFTFDPEDVPVFNGADPIQFAAYGVASAATIFLNMIEF